MAILFNINGLFAIDSTGAMELGGAAGASTYVLMSNGAGNANSWYDVQSKFAEYLPLTGGTLTGNLALTDAANNPSLVISTGSLTVGGNATFSSAVFTGGKLGVGTSDPGAEGYSYAEDLVILGGNSASDGAGITIRNNGKRYSVIAFGNGAGATGNDNDGEIYYDQTNKTMNFRTDHSPIVTFTNVGKVVAATATVTADSANTLATKGYVDGIGGGVSKIIASTNITISPVTGLGDVTISATDTNTTYTSGNGITFTGTPATVINADINYISYSGSNNFIVYGAQDGLGTTIPTGSIISYVPSSGTQIVTKAYVSDLPFTNNTGDLTSITLGNGLTGSSLTGPIPNILMSGSYTGTFTSTAVATDNVITSAGSLIINNPLDQNSNLIIAGRYDLGATTLSFRSGHGGNANVWDMATI